MKTVIITGANSGLGKATAYKFAHERYRVIMACRNLQSANLIRSQIISDTGNSDIEAIELDMSSFSSIVNFSQLVQDIYIIDALILNAGHFCHGYNNYVASIDRMELSFAVNAFGPFVLSCLLADAMLKSTSGAKVTAACTINIQKFHNHQNKIDLSLAYNKPKAFSAYRAYGDSKAVLFVLMSYLSKKYPTICFNSLLIPSVQMEKATLQKFKGLYRIAATIQNRFIRKPHTVADLYYHISNSPKKQSGHLFNLDGQIVNKIDSSIKRSSMQIAKLNFSTEYYPEYLTDQNLNNQVIEMAEDALAKAKQYQPHPR